MRTLQLELEYICGCLEDEALDIGQGTQNPAFLLSRQVCLHLQLCRLHDINVLACLRSGLPVCSLPQAQRLTARTSQGCCHCGRQEISGKLLCSHVVSCERLSGISCALGIPGCM